MVAIVTLAVWGAVPWGTFQFDDFTNVVRDPATSDLGALVARLPEGLRPLTRVSYALDAHLWGLHAGGFLATNLALHLGTALLVFALARRRLDLMGACVAALLFSVQPANAEVVAYVSGRSTGLMTPLLVSGLLFHDRGRHVLALGMFALACMAKEVALVFPALVGLWELTRAGTRNLRAVVLYAIGAIVIAALILALSRYRELVGISNAGGTHRGLAETVLANGRAIWTTLSLWFRPWALSADHDFAPTGHDTAALVGLTTIAAMVCVAGWALRHGHGMFALAIAWPLIALLPTNSIIAKLDPVTEKPLYVACIGPAMALGSVLTRLLATRARQVTLVVTACVLCALGATAWWRASLWRDPVRLWRDAVAKAPESSRCWNNLGMSYLSAARDAEAYAAFERAVRLEPANPIATKNLATARLLCGSACL